MTEHKRHECLGGRYFCVFAKPLGAQRLTGNGNRKSCWQFSSEQRKTARLFRLFCLIRLFVLCHFSIRALALSRRVAFRPADFYAFCICQG
ncbi:hypothetical protein PWR63_26965 [Paraburkholderia sp. A2WS-5]|uniref:hypothetical protein n=1 Tax=unclassified Paraburkholderia TaxID=2615204 RepID=UPI003B7BD5A9